MGNMGSKLLGIWDKTNRFPGGNLLFNRLLFKTVPYSGSIHAKVVALETGYAKVVLREHRSIRNHFNCVHAIALANLGELSTGLATTMRIPEGMNGIVVKVQTEYFKKARGVLTSEARVPPLPREAKTIQVTTEIKNESNVVVAKFSADWILGFIKER